MGDWNIGSTRVKKSAKGKARSLNRAKVMRPVTATLLTLAKKRLITMIHVSAWPQVFPQDCTNTLETAFSVGPYRALPTLGVENSMAMHKQMPDTPVAKTVLMIP